jgi:uncharacterized protein
MKSELTASILWCRIDTPGHDACWLTQHSSGCELSGTAVFKHDERVASLHYRLLCDHDWQTIEAHITGSFGDETIDRSIRRSGSKWEMNGELISGLDECIDLDLGFTPATNLVQLRRLNLQMGESATYTVAWLDDVSFEIRPLVQHYERRSETSYWYESPSTGYQALLEVSRDGFITSYPELWQVE